MSWFLEHQMPYLPSDPLDWMKALFVCLLNQSISDGVRFPTFPSGRRKNSDKDISCQFFFFFSEESTFLWEAALGWPYLSVLYFGLFAIHLETNDFEELV